MATRDDNIPHAPGRRRPGRPRAVPVTAEGTVLTRGEEALTSGPVEPAPETASVAPTAPLTAEPPVAAAPPAAPVSDSASAAAANTDFSAFIEALAATVTAHVDPKTPEVVSPTERVSTIKEVFMGKVLSTAVKVAIILGAIPIGFIFFALLYTPGAALANFQHATESMLITIWILSIILFRGTNGVPMEDARVKKKLTAWICPGTPEDPHKPLRYKMSVKACQTCMTRQSEVLAAMAAPLEGN